MADRTPMWSDNETDEDLLGFDTLAETIANLVRRDELLPLTIGVFGDWGSGKSSLMRIARAMLKEPNVATLMFSPWQHEDYSDVRSALMAEVVDAVESKQSVGEKMSDDAKGQVALLIRSLRRRINVFQLLGLAATTGPLIAAVLSNDPSSFDIAGLIPQALPIVSKVADAAAKTMDSERDERSVGTETADMRVAAFRRDLQELIKTAGVDRIVIFVDDLDRCLPGNIVDLLEVIKLFLAVPRTAFVIGADERLVRHAVGRRYPELADEIDSVSRDYLEKMIQIPIRIPPMTPAETQTYLNLLGCQAYLDPVNNSKVRTLATRRRGGASLGKPLEATDIAAEAGALPPGLAEHLRVAALVTPVIGVQLKGNPRLTKRFVNTMNQRVELASRRGLALKPAVLAKLMVLEYFHEREFRTLFSVLSPSGMTMGIGALERLARASAPAPVADSKGVPLELQSWLSSVDLASWLAMEPTLDGVNLAPYFYYSRDRVALGPVAGLGLPADLQEVLSSLLSPIEVERDLGYGKAKALVGEPVSALFAEICARLSREPDAVAGDLVKRALSLARLHSELVPELARALQAAPTKELPTSLGMTIFATWQRKPPAPLVDVVRRWSEQKAHAQLATRSAQALKQLG